jgi:NADPH:quinone reductase-like Zn-dependent oxidoreductase
LRRVVIHRPGGYERLSIESGPDPQPGPGEVLVDVEAAGVNFADCITRMGLYASARELVGYPITPGFEVAGRVAAVGDGVVDLVPGQAVVGVTVFGGYASRIVLTRGNVFAMPEGWDPLHAAGFPTVYLTAWYALFELVHPRPGDRVLVHSGAGGVGSALVRLARLAGCRVVAVVGAAHKVDAAAAAGAEAVIDTSSRDLWQEARRHARDGYAAVFDANGVPTLAQSYRHLAPTGKLVVYGFHGMFARGRGRPDWLRLAWGALRTPRFNPLRMTLQNRSVLAFNLSFLGDRQELLQEGMGKLLEWARQGRIEPLITTAYPLEEVAEAHRALESGRTVGKLVLSMH